MLDRRLIAVCALLLSCFFTIRASAQNPTLDQAKSIYSGVDARGGGARVSTEMARAKASIDAADSAIANGHDQATSDAMATQALHDAQAADAANTVAYDRAVADSLHTTRLNQLVALSQAQRDRLFSQNQLSHSEVVDLRARNLLTVTQADSLKLQLDSLKAASADAQAMNARRQDSMRVVQAQLVRQQDSIRISQAAANEVHTSDSRQTDSLRAIATSAQRQVDSMRYAASQASRAQTEAERLRTDSLQRAATRASLESDSLRRLVARGGYVRDSLRARDSVRALTDVSARQQDSVRIAQATLDRARVQERLRSDSMQQSIALSAQIADSMRAASVRASVRETAAERVRSDSLRRVGELTNARLDSLRRAAAQTQRQRDSVQAVAEASSKEIDSLRNQAAASARANEALKADVEARTKLNASVSTISRTAPALKTPTLSPRGLVVTIGDASFLNGTPAGARKLSLSSKRDIGKLTPAIAEYQNYHVVVQGYSDSTARLDAGDALADARAQAVRDALVAGGLDAGRVETQVIGHAQPVAPNTTIAGRRTNRRVEIVVSGTAAQ